LNAFHFSTDGYRGADKIAVWRETFGQKIAKLDMQPIGHQPFRGEAHVHSFTNLTIGSISSTPNRIARTSALVADGSDDIMLGIVLKGMASVTQQGHEEVTLGCGDGVVWSNSSTGHSYYPESLDFLSIAIPRHVIVPHLLHPDLAILTVIPHRAPALQLMTDYVQALQRETMSQPLEVLAATHVHDLVAMAIGPTRDAAHIATQRGMAAARLQAIQADIAANVADPDLSVAALARRHGISPRMIRTLFSREDTTFTDFLLERRLARVHRLLLMPNFSGRTVSSIAFDSGFGDISYFNKAFRRRYGATPSDVRAAGLSSL
jgi:AraC-like DNA-binding protein